MAIARFEDFYDGKNVQWDEEINKLFKTLTRWYSDTKRKFFKVGETLDGEVGFYRSKEVMKNPNSTPMAVPFPSIPKEITHEKP